MKMDTSTKAVERLLDGTTEGPWMVDASNRIYAGDPRTGSRCEVSHVVYRDNDARFFAAARTLVPALLKERDEAVDAKLDALSTLDAWFDRRKLGNEAVNQAVIDAASGYLRTSRVGGMPQVESDLILGVMQDMSRLGLFADIFARAMNDLVTTLLKERDEARARVAPSLRITGPNSDGEYWLHIKAGGRSGGVNLGGEHGQICKRLFDAASETGAKE